MATVNASKPPSTRSLSVVGPPQSPLVLAPPRCDLRHVDPSSIFMAFFDCLVTLVCAWMPPFALSFSSRTVRENTSPAPQVLPPFKEVFVLKVSVNHSTTIDNLRIEDSQPFSQSMIYICERKQFAILHEYSILKVALLMCFVLALTVDA